jgi:hypothetical protein
MEKFNDAYALLSQFDDLGDFKKLKEVATTTLFLARQTASPMLELLVLSTAATKYAESNDIETAFKLLNAADNFLNEKKGLANAAEANNLQIWSVQLPFLMGTTLLKKTKPNYADVKSNLDEAYLRAQSLISNVNTDSTDESNLNLPINALKILQMEALKMMGWCDEQSEQPKSALHFYGKAVKISEGLSPALRQKSCLKSIGISMLLLFRKNSQKYEHEIVSQKMTELMGINWEK